MLTISAISGLKNKSNILTINNEKINSQSKEVSFSGIKDIFCKKPDDKLPINVVGNIRLDFIEKIKNNIKNFPQYWQNIFKENNYKIILSPTLSDAYKSQNVFDPIIDFFEKQNPRGTLGCTYSEGKFGKNFFAFCDKPPASDVFMSGIVNHELSHGVVNVSGLDKKGRTLELIKKDVALIEKEAKLKNLDSNEKQMISHYFFNSNAYLPVDEIIADIYAWNNGGGCYGSGLVFGVKNPDLLKHLFPNLNSFLSKL